ncbi:3-oxoacyl-ACP reductase FabG [Sporichthya sp.]|uniref:3-oxoacyl-ACP reductase FabG n=1 Tax=Sporichthya sp. TaxID=65475 RepID=UPI00180E8375|nr:3-oxoacyl-ACP reductase FabG [Sporichthya sp.]MBA3744225.1 3-oxoacyl-ACP reductase FabG [Sporichthya sp.]
MSGTQGRTALITGAGQGIGAAIAMRLAADGASVAVLDRNAETAAVVAKRIVESGGKAIAVGADVTDRAEVTAAVETTVAAFGALSILVNNAGVTRDNLLFKMSDEDWSTVVDVHLRGAFLCSQIAHKHMVDAKYGRIINMSSMSALGNRGQTNYSAAKAGLQGMTRTLAIELGPFGITVNAIGPGFVETAMTAATAERVGASMEEFKERVAAALPVRRTGTPAEIAHAVAFLAADESWYVTGQVLYVDGGGSLR